MVSAILARGVGLHEVEHFLRGMAVMAATFVWAGSWSRAILWPVLAAPILLMAAIAFLTLDRAVAALVCCRPGTAVFRRPLRRRARLSPAGLGIQRHPRHGGHARLASSGGGAGVRSRACARMALSPIARIARCLRRPLQRGLLGEPGLFLQRLRLSAGAARTAAARARIMPDRCRASGRAGRADAGWPRLAAGHKRRRRRRSFLPGASGPPRRPDLYLQLAAMSGAIA